MKGRRSLSGVEQPLHVARQQVDFDVDRVALAQCVEGSVADGVRDQRDLEARGIHIRTASYAGLAEEAGAAYKNIDDVVDATRRAGVSHPVARFVPIGNIKG